VVVPPKETSLEQVSNLIYIEENDINARTQRNNKLNCIIKEHFGNYMTTDIK
jgi:hypothetical protein